METLNRLASSFSSSVTSTVFSTVNTLNNVLPGNPVNREFEVTEHIASAGPGLAWKVYKGFKKSTRQSAAVFVLEKRALDKHDKSERELLLEQHRRAVSQLTRLRHPQVLTVQHPLEESRDCLAFATEPVYASLANVLGRHDQLPQPVPAHIRNYKMFDVEIKYGLLQLSEGLHFLHDSVKLLHRNLSPESILLNEQGAWKIFGFDFSLSNTAPANQPAAWAFPEYSPQHTIQDGGLPDLDFLAPEYALAGACDTAADMFSLGMVAFALYNSKPLFDSGGNWGVFKRNAGQLKALRESNLQLIPADLRDYLKMLLNVTPELRPDAAQFCKIGFFDDVGVRTLNSLDSQFQWDNLQKSQFYKGLPAIIPKLPHRVALHRVVPCLAKEYVNPHMVPFVLPAVLQVAEEATQQDFVQHILPELKPVMKLTDPVQILLIFMQRMEMLLSKTPPTDVKSDVLPMIYRALESDASQIQELCLSIIPGFAGLLDYQAMKNALLPRIKKLCMSTTLLSVRVNSLICVGKLLNTLDKWLVIDEILPMLQQIPSREPAVIMGIIGIYKMSFSDDKLGLTKEVMASKALPFLLPLSIENGLTISQYNVITGLIHQMMTRVEDEHKVKLEQLNSIQDEQRSALQLSMSEGMQTKKDQLVSAPPTGPGHDMDDMFAGLGLGSYVERKDTGAIATGMLPSAGAATGASSPSTTDGKHLSLEEKRRMVQQSESMQRLNNAKQLTPNNATQKNASVSQQQQQQQRVDLTQTLIDRNLTQMKSSAGAFNSPASQGGGSANSGGWGNFAGAASASPAYAQFASPVTPPQQQQQQQPKTDLSSFDSLLAMPSSRSKPSMNAMTTPTQRPMGAQQQQQQPGIRPMGGGPSPAPAKGLSANDISDLLG